jgi:alpha-glucosidase
MKKKFPFILVFLLAALILHAQKNQYFTVKSPDENISLNIEIGSKISWCVEHKGQEIIAPSVVSLHLEGGKILGENARARSKIESVDREIQAINYKKAIIPDQYNQVTLNCRNDFGLIFRVYNEAVAYRFFTTIKGDITILNEDANFNFTADYKAFIPYMIDYRDGRIFNCSFESQYDVQNISQFKPDSLAFLPLLVDVGNGKKVVILEADLEDYPGMFLNINETRKGFMGVYAPYPLKVERKGINYIPIERADYIARTSGTRSFPWRTIVISENDKELLNIDIIQKLASPPRIDDISWIEPGQVAWDWWNAMNISHVDFRAGINTDTYRYYIDFAAANGIRYIIMDGGWSSFGNLAKTRPEIDLPAILAHGKQKGVGVVLWASWYGILQQMDEIFPLYADMGVKGFKIDFFDRDDQVAVASTYEIAKKAAEYHLIVDYHGIYKPTGLQRTYPNVVGYEGVQGLEYTKWSREEVPRYDVTIPYIRMMAGPMDYTPGAMRNANRDNFRAINANPMSQGTRCHQLAMYVIFEVPFQMLADNPTIYRQEQECTGFIVKVPTTFDETVPLDGKVGEYVALARRKGDTWYIGAMTNWDARELTFDLSFLDEGNYRAVIFRDGINADRDATDYVREEIPVTSGDQLKINMSTGGGWVARIEKVR